MFICNQDEIASKLKTLIKTDVTDNGWTHHYTDQATNEKWLLTHYHSEYHGGGVAVLKRLPELEVLELINIAMTSGDANDITGASIELLEREKNKKEDFRDQLLSCLLQTEISNLTQFERERFKTIIYESELYSPRNRRDIMGKHFTEIDKDVAYFRSISQKAKQILVDLDKFSN